MPILAHFHRFSVNFRPITLIGAYWPGVSTHTCILIQKQSVALAPALGKSSGFQGGFECMLN